MSELPPKAINYRQDSMSGLSVRRNKGVARVSPILRRQWQPFRGKHHVQLIVVNTLPQEVTCQEGFGESMSR